MEIFILKETFYLPWRWKAVNIITGMRGYILMLTGYGYIQMNITIFCGLLNVLLCFFGMYYFGLIGVATSASLALIIQCILEMYFVKKKINISTYFSYKQFKYLIREYR